MWSSVEANEILSELCNILKNGYEEDIAENLLVDAHFFTLPKLKLALNHLKERTGNKYRFPPKSANKAIVVAFFCKVINDLWASTRTSLGSSYRPTDTVFGSNNGNQIQSRNPVPLSPPKAKKSTADMWKQRELSNIRKSHPKYHHILVNGGDVLNASLSSLCSELTDMGFLISECRDAIIECLHIDDIYVHDLTQLTLPDSDTVMFAIIDKRELKSKETQDASKYGIGHLHTNSKSINSSCNNNNDHISVGSFDEMKWLEETVEIEDRIILESEKEKDVIQQRKKNREHNLMFDWDGSSGDDVDILTAPEFVNSLLLHQFVLVGAVEGVSNVSKLWKGGVSGDATSSSSVSNNSCVGEAYAPSIVRLYVDWISAAADFEKIVQTPYPNRCCNCGNGSHKLKHIRSRIVKLLLIEKLALQWYHEHCSEYLHGVHVRLAHASEYTDSGVDVTCMAIENCCQSCSCVMSSLDKEKSDLELALYEMPAVHGGIPVKFLCGRPDPSTLFRLQDDGFEVVEVVNDPIPNKSTRNRKDYYDGESEGD